MSYTNINPSVYTLTFKAAWLVEIKEKTNVIVYPSADNYVARQQITAIVLVCHVCYWCMFCLCGEI